MSRSDEGQGIDRDTLQGTPKDPTGTDALTTETDTGQEQRLTHGLAGREGGAAGKFTRESTVTGQAETPEHPPK